MGAKRDIVSVNIRPGVSILSVLRHLNYKPWYAIAEFVDNSLQSYLDNQDTIRRIDGKKSKLHVAISISTTDGSIAIKDNAGGIAASEFPRAFRPAEIPPDRSGLSEFGMGMKSAACWFASRWSVRTSALGERQTRTIEFDIDRIVEDNIQELRVASEPTRPDLHFTEIYLIDLHRPLQGRTIGKIKEHLASIYRVYLRDGLMVLRFDETQLSFKSPKVLCAPDYRKPRSTPIEWRRDIDFSLEDGQLRVRGFAALRETGSTSEAGFALFRRNRLIQGSADEAYRPQAIFGSPNSYRSQRLFGELHLEGFEVSHTKDGFRWENHEDEFVDALRKLLSQDPSLLRQAEGYRANPPIAAIAKAAGQALARTADVVEQQAPQVIQKLESAKPAKEPPKSLPRREAVAAQRTMTIAVEDAPWCVKVELITDASGRDWIELSDTKDATAGEDGQAVRRIAVRLNLLHPFMVRFGGVDDVQLEPLIRIATALAIAETTSRDSGVRGAGTIRRNINTLLRGPLAQP
jgi:hypothetical protein